MSEINTIKTKYVNWLTGENVNYSNASVNTRYTAFRAAGIQALDLSQYNFVNPGSAWDFSIDADKNEFFNITEKSLIRLIFYIKSKVQSRLPTLIIIQLP
ncbi:hypothetical protein BOQ62_09860 [Chryseobacterium sp. CH21]|nr:hypothetical protein BOQ62_09860 [Chryseobacterium sp. CH21]